MNEVQARPALPAEALPDRFAVETGVERARLLQRLLEANAPLTLQRPGTDPLPVAARLLSVEPSADRVELHLLGGSAAAATLADAERLYGGATLEGVQLRIELGPARLENGERGRLLLAPMPRRMAWLQRRDAFRVAPPPGVVPRLFVPVAGKPHEARVLDVSATGIGFEWPAPDRVPAVGSQIAGCRLELPSTGPIRLGLAVRTATPCEDGPTRLGAAFVGVDPPAERSIQVFVNHPQTQARRNRPSAD